MRYSSEHKQGTRARLLATTGALVKKNGFAATGVDGLMAAVGLTSGAFYSHFRSKSELLEAIIANELKRSGELFSNKTLEQTLTAIEGYLSPAHVTHPGSGCVVPALAAEIARAGETTQKVFEQGIVELKENIRNLVKDDATAWAVIAQLVGAVTVARGLPSDRTRNALLKGVTQQVKQMLESQSSTAGP
jgi:TetR/AcrR family transcriptional regulator, transcriptional repressor for nem operon